MKEIQIITTIDELSRTELSTTEQQLILAAQHAASTAYAPYSGFSVGAAVLLENGEIISGSNQENAAYPSGLCAERVALFYAGAQYPNITPVMLAITAMKKGMITEEPVPPCAACRQVMLEVEYRYNKSFSLLLNGGKRIYRIKRAGDLVPLKFSESHLDE